MVAERVRSTGRFYETKTWIAHHRRRGSNVCDPDGAASGVGRNVDCGGGLVDGRGAGRTAVMYSRGDASGHSGFLHGHPGPLHAPGSALPRALHSQLASFLDHPFDVLPQPRGMPALCWSYHSLDDLPLVVVDPSCTSQCYPHSQEELYNLAQEAVAVATVWETHDPLAKVEVVKMEAENQSRLEWAVDFLEGAADFPARAEMGVHMSGVGAARRDRGLESCDWVSIQTRPGCWGFARC